MDRYKARMLPRGTPARRRKNKPGMRAKAKAEARRNHIASLYDEHREDKYLHSYARVDRWVKQGLVG